uniref:NADH dehydrogenase subunit 4 n=1 Tax=Pentapycnon charcoti TaxID=373304 RepID=UPI00226D3F63|nr:NADH dehydrogenase subunit 4 [Pentapycnon charcoti]UZA61217.1 NADH dehydrogenase subunit 4 [Pentapycnon charcoti]
MLFMCFMILGLVMYPFIFIFDTICYWWFILLSLLFLFIICIFNFYKIFCFYDFIYMDFGFDMMSFMLFSLAIWIIFLMVFSSFSFYKSSNFLVLCLLIMFFLFCCFYSLNFFMFYFFFESVLIPTFILILGWGYQPERLQSILYLLFYTIFASLPLFMSIFYLYKYSFSLNMLYLNYLILFNFFSNWLIMIWFFFMIFAFLVKVPIYFFHLWLPKAHVEAPLSGSMILAGVLLKLGGYGLFRMFNVFKFILLFLNCEFMMFIIFGSLLSSLICLSQIDLKMLVAYSSIVHMGLMITGLFVFNSFSINGSLLIMISHGLCSSCMFVLVNIIYERTFTRSSLFYKGFINIYPGLMVWWFLISICNLSAPPSMNLLGELFIYMSLIIFNNILIFILFFFFLFCSCYGIYFFYSSYHGKMNNFYSMKWVCVREYLVLLYHWVPLNMFILKSDLFMLYY